MASSLLCTTSRYRRSSSRSWSVCCLKAQLSYPSHLLNPNQPLSASPPTPTTGLAFSESERDRLYLRGLLPPAVLTQEVQLERSILNIRSKESPLDKHNYLSSLQGRNERLFYRCVFVGYWWAEGWVDGGVWKRQAAGVAVQRWGASVISWACGGLRWTRCKACSRLGTCFTPYIESNVDQHTRKITATPIMPVHVPCSWPGSTHQPPLSTRIPMTQSFTPLSLSHPRPPPPPLLLQCADGAL